MGYNYHSGHQQAAPLSTKAQAAPMSGWSGIKLAQHAEKQRHKESLVRTAISEVLTHTQQELPPSRF